MKNPGNISKEHIIQPWKNGIKLITPDNDKEASDLSVDSILKNSFNIYFMNTDSQLVEINEQTVINCGYESVHDAIGRTARDVAQNASAENLIYNDKKVVKRNNPEISDDIFEGLKDNYFNCLSLKFPWYGNHNKIIGIFGCSIVLNKHSLSQSITQIKSFGLLSKTLPIIEIDNAVLSKREISCLQLYARGKSAREVSEAIGLSKRTVEHYLENIKIKLLVSTKSELIEKAIHYFRLYN